MLVFLLVFAFITTNSLAKTQFKIKFSSASVPTDTHTIAMDVFKKEVEKTTNKEIIIENYNSGQLFTQDSQYMALVKGTLDMAYIDFPWLSQYIPKLTMFTAGYIFDDYQHMRRVLSGKIGKQLYEDIIRTLGVRPLSTFYLGTRELNLRDIGREVRTPKDLKGVKLRMPNTPSWLFLGKALGANPVPLSFNELYMALNYGAVDGQDNPLPSDKNAKFYEVTKYIIMTDHYVNPIIPAINEKLWKKLGTKNQKKILAAIEKARLYCDKTNLAAEEKLVSFFKKEGLIVIVPNKKAFKTKVLKAYLDDKEMTSTWDMDLYKQVQSLSGK
jgi:tripartite ATP-independent transporter DctP family solute receptor